jgi:hypothetical protein
MFFPFLTRPPFKLFRAIAEESVKVKLRRAEVDPHPRVVTRALVDCCHMAADRVASGAWRHIVAALPQLLASSSTVNR